jgi:CheY-like chemotaxis protein
MLFVDDDWRQWSGLLRRAGRKRGWEVESVPTVEKGLSLLDSEGYDLVLLDLGFPKGQLQGHTALRRIREKRPHVPVIILTASDAAADIRTAVDCMKLGAWEYFTKSRLDVRKLFGEADKAVRLYEAGGRRQRLVESFNRLVGKPPAFVHFCEGDEHTVVFGLRLTGIGLRLEHERGRDGTSEWLGNQLVWQRKLVGGLLCQTPGRQVELRYTAVPSGRESAVEVTILGRGTSSHEDEARAIADELWVDLESLLKMNEAVYPFAPVEYGSELQQSLQPFQVKHIAEIRRTGLPLSLETQSGSLGFGVRAEAAGAKTRAITIPWPIEPGQSTLRALCEVLLNHRHSLLVSVILESSRLLPADLAHAIQNGLDGRAGYHARVATDTEPRDLNPEEHALVRTRVLALREEHGFCLRVLVASQRPIPRAILNVVGGELISERSSLWDVVPWTNRELDGAVRPYGLCLPPLSEADRLLPAFTATEAANIFRLPVTTQGQVPGIPAIRPQFAYLPPMLPESGCLLGAKRGAGATSPIRITEEDRRKHVYILGQTGTGKSTLLSTMILSDIREGRGLCLLDPHGDLVEFILPRIPRERADDVILFDPSDEERPIGLNLFDWRSPRERDFLVQEAVLMFYKLFDPNRIGIVGPQWEHWFRNAALTLMAEPRLGTLVEVPRLFVDDAFRDKMLSRVTDSTVRDFWERQLRRTSDFHKSEMLNFFVSKFGRFASNETMRRIIGQAQSALNFSEIMDGGRVLLVNLSKGRIGPVNSDLLGMIAVTRLCSSAMGRAESAAETRRDFCVYIDEFQTFTTDTIADMVGEVRKYGLALVLANQNLHQLLPKIRDNVLGNAGTLLCFRPGVVDAELVSRYFSPYISERDLLTLPNWTACARLMVAERPSLPFVFGTMKDDAPARPEVAEMIRKASRMQYGRDREEVDRELTDRWGSKGNDAMRDWSEDSPI